MHLSIVVLVVAVLAAAAHAASDPPEQIFFNSGSRQVRAFAISQIALRQTRFATLSS
jgi:hypothetical protein